MCEACYAYEDDYVDREWVFGEALEEIADLHTAVWTPSRLASGAALCDACGEWWPCVTFLTAVGAINDAR